MNIRSIGIDLGKTTFHLVALGDRGKILLKKKMSRKGLLALTANLAPSLIGLEAWLRSTFRECRPCTAVELARCNYWHNQRFRTGNGISLRSEWRLFGSSP